MGRSFARLTFTPAVAAIQTRMGSRASYARMEAQGADDAILGEDELSFIALRDSFYMASVGETGWPYVQHRGGPAGFVRPLGPRTLGFADFRGNRQYISVGNLGHDGRVSLMFMDYPNQTRLKVLGHARVVEDAETLAQLAVGGYAAKVERAIVLDVAAFDWNCPQHITPRYTAAEVANAVAPLHQRIAELEAALDARRT